MSWFEKDKKSAGSKPYLKTQQQKIRENRKWKNIKSENIGEGVQLVQQGHPTEKPRGVPKDRVLSIMMDIMNMYICDEYNCRQTR